MDRTNASNDIDLKIQEREIQGYFNSKHVQTKHLRINVSAAIKKKINYIYPWIQEENESSSKKKISQIRKRWFQPYESFVIYRDPGKYWQSQWGREEKKNMQWAAYFPVLIVIMLWGLRNKVVVPVPRYCSIWTTYQIGRIHFASNLQFAIFWLCE